QGVGDHELFFYREALPRIPVGAIRCYGFFFDGECDWIFLEDAGNRPYSAVSGEHRKLAATWLASMHACTSLDGMEARLPNRTPDFYLEQLGVVRTALSSGCSN